MWRMNFRQRFLFNNKSVNSLIHQCYNSSCPNVRKTPKMLFSTCTYNVEPKRSDALWTINRCWMMLMHQQVQTVKPMTAESTEIVTWLWHVFRGEPSICAEDLDGRIGDKENRDEWFFRGNYAHLINEAKLNYIFISFQFSDSQPVVHILYPQVAMLHHTLSSPFVTQEAAEEAGFAARPPEWAKRLKVSCSSWVGIEEVRPRVCVNFQFPPIKTDLIWYQEGKKKPIISYWNLWPVCIHHEGLQNYLQKK